MEIFYGIKANMVGLIKKIDFCKYTSLNRYNNFQGYTLRRHRWVLNVSILDEPS